jgi:phage tail sheath protein FI
MVMAGIYCKVDSTEGVWKAPANVALLGIGEPSVSITDLQQESLNVDAISGKSINAIRKFYGRGILPWGARTNAGNDGEWKYIPVRRLAIAIETDINLGLKPFVFKPNVHNTWVEIKTMIESYLSGLFRQGALMGNTLDQACQVRIGLGITMTDQDILDGNLKFDVLFAPLRPGRVYHSSFQAAGGAIG